jgi:hypothetical protein
MVCHHFCLLSTIEQCSSSAYFRISLNDDNAASAAAARLKGVSVQAVASFGCVLCSKRDSTKMYAREIFC